MVILLYRITEKNKRPLVGSLKYIKASLSSQSCKNSSKRAGGQNSGLGCRLIFLALSSSSRTCSIHYEVELVVFTNHYKVVFVVFLTVILEVLKF